MAFVIGVSNAQTKLKVTKNVNQGEFVDFSGTNLTPSDSLAVTDTIAYIIPVTHVNLITPFLTTYWQKIGAGTAAVTVKFYQSNDPTNANFVSVKKGKLLTDYTKLLTLSASGWNHISFVSDTANLEGRYLKVLFVTDATASVKGKLFNRMKFNIK